MNGEDIEIFVERIVSILYNGLNRLKQRGLENVSEDEALSLYFQLEEARIESEYFQESCANIGARKEEE